MALRKTDYVDDAGRKKSVLLPEGAEAEPEKGIPVGPPSLESLELPLELEVRLNNELFHRGILTAFDALRNRGELTAALQAALKVDAERVLQEYVGKDYVNGRREAESSQEPTENRRQPRVNASKANLSESDKW